MKDNLGHGSDARGGGSRSYGGLSRQKYIPTQPATQSEYTPGADAGAGAGVAGTYARFGQEMKRLQAGVAARGSVRRQNKSAAATLGGGHPKAGRVSTHPGMATQAFRSVQAAFRKYDG